MTHKQTDLRPDAAANEEARTYLTPEEAATIIDQLFEKCCTALSQAGAIGFIGSAVMPLAEPNEKGVGPVLTRSYVYGNRPGVEAMRVDIADIVAGGPSPRIITN